MSLENLLLGLFSTRFCVSCHTFPSRNLQRSDLFLPILLTDDTKAGSKYASTIPFDGAHLLAVWRAQLGVAAKAVRPTNLLNHNVKT